MHAFYILPCTWHVALMHATCRHATLYKYLGSPWCHSRQTTPVNDHWSIITWFGNHECSWFLFVSLCVISICFPVFYSLFAFHQVGLVGSLLMGPAETWFAILVETVSPLMEDFPAFLAEFETSFGETNHRRVALNMIYSLQQGKRVVSTYASKFCQLVCTMGCRDQELWEQFRRGLRSDV